ncbi:MAG: hypothetical protein KDA78_10285, partial [Planctomycetaceae bacterium]|nr:hypothetical protein [Planctomycetaceae bacterium]
MSHAEEVKQPKYVDFAEYILFQVRRTQSLIRQADLWQLLITSVCAISFLMLLWILLDHWAFSAGLSSPLRWLGFFSLVGSLAYAGYVYYRDGGRRSVTSLYAAKTLETSQQDFQNSLFTLMDLDYHGKPTSSYIRGSLEKRAALTLNNLDVEEAIDRQALLHRLYVLIAVVVVLFGYASLGPKSSLDSILRVLLPWTASTAPTQTRLVNILPGSAVVTTGAHVEVSVYVEGKVPDNVWLKYATADRRIVDEQVSLTESGDDLGKYTGVITGENGRGIDQTTTYWIEAGDARSSEYVLTIKPAPVAVINSLVITPPAYTERPSYRQTEGTIDALEGSEVTLTAQTNIPVEKAWIQLYEADDPASRSGQLPLEIAEQTRLEGNWKLLISDEGTYPHYYSIECESAEGARDPAPPRHPILIRP